MESSDLRKIRLELGLKQAEFASYLKTPYETYSNWERGKCKIPGIAEVAIKKVRSDLKVD